jgi:pyruvate carboxylase subunit B
VKYVVTVDGQTIELSLEGDAARIEGARVDAHVDDLEGTPISLVTIGGVVHRVVVRREQGRGRYSLWLGGRRFDVEALDERTHAIRQLSAASGVAAGPTSVIAPMPGLIVRVGVEPGDAVQAGQPLVVIEAMKMENELRAPAAGTVRTVHVAAGSAVEKGAVLVEFDPQGPPR